MNSDVQATLVRVQRRVVSHYGQILKRQHIPERERTVLQEKMAHHERVLEEYSSPAGESADRSALL